MDEAAEKTMSGAIVRATRREYEQPTWKAAKLATNRATEDAVWFATWGHIEEAAWYAHFASADTAIRLALLR